MKRIIIAEDSTTMRLYLRMCLRKIHGVIVTESVDGLDAIEKIREEQFDLLITDLNMPNMGGLKLIEHVRTMGLTVPIIILTTCGEEKDVARGLELGANDYVTKPITGPTLTNLVMNYVMAA